MNTNFKHWEPYEFESLKADVPLRYFKRSRETLTGKLVALESQIMKASEISAWLKETAEKNGGLLF